MKDFSKYKLEETPFFSSVKISSAIDDANQIGFLINDFFHFCRKDKGEETLFGSESISKRFNDFLESRKYSDNGTINRLRETAIGILDLSDTYNLSEDPFEETFEENKEYVLWRDGLSDEDRKKHKLENMTEEDKKRMSYHMVGKEPSSKQISFLRSLGVVEVPKDMAHASRLIDERLKKGVARSNTTFLESQSWGER